MDDKGIQLLDASKGVPQQCYGALDDGKLCGEMLTDELNICPVCERLTVWKRSKVWRRKFGTWSAFSKRYFDSQDGDARTPKTKLGKRLLVFAGKDHWGNKIIRFSKKDHLKQWTRIEREMNDVEIKEVVNRCINSGSKGYGLVYHTLRSCNLVIECRPDKTEVKQSVFEGLGNE